MLIETDQLKDALRCACQLEQPQSYLKKLHEIAKRRNLTWLKTIISQSFPEFADKDQESPKKKSWMTPSNDRWNRLIFFRVRKLIEKQTSFSNNSDWWLIQNEYQRMNFFVHFIEVWETRLKDLHYDLYFIRYLFVIFFSFFLRSSDIFYLFHFFIISYW